MNQEPKIRDILSSSIQMARQGAKCSSHFFEEYRRRKGIARLAESDRSIYLKMYGTEPTRIGLQKMRFWRLGQHLPQSREEALLLGQAMELSGEELDKFLKEHCLTRGLKPGKNQTAVFSELFPEYLCQVTDERLKQLNILPGMQQLHRRHIFYTDALDCIRMDEKTRQLCYQQHMYSRGFSGEFRKYFQQDSILPRETVMRLLILLMMPDLDQEIISSQLEQLGYAPLDESREQTGYVDYAVSHMLALCAMARTGNRVKDRERMKELLRQYDTLAAELIGEQKLLRRLRFMKFRSMGNEGAPEHRPGRRKKDGEEKKCTEIQ